MSKVGEVALLFGIFGVMLVVLTLIKLKNKPETVSAIWNKLRSQRYGQDIVNCVLKQKPKQIRRNFVSVINFCVGKHSKISRASFTTLKTGSKSGERKWFLIPEEFEFKKFSETGCLFVTIGIAEEIGAEKKFSDKFNETCKIFGIGLKSARAEEFAKYGTVIDAAVGVKRDSVPLRIRTKYGDEKLEFTDVIPLHQILHKHVGSRLIHFASLDVDAGLEYDILNGLKLNGELRKEGVKFCQIDVQLYDVKEKKINFGRFFKDLIANSWYIPVHAERFSDHKKVTLIDGRGNDICETLFRFSSYLS